MCDARENCASPGSVSDPYDRSGERTPLQHDGVKGRRVGEHALDSLAPAQAPRVAQVPLDSAHLAVHGDDAVCGAEKVAVARADNGAQLLAVLARMAA
jgi:hypothetical protein